MLHRSFSIRHTQKNFSRVVQYYDFWGKLTEQKAINAAVSIADIQNGVKILDVGVGTGQLFEKIINLNDEGFNSGLDLSYSMLTRAKEKLNSKLANYSLAMGNAYKLPYKGGIFDFIFRSYVLDLLPENTFGIVLSEFSRVMKSGGIGILITMSIGDKLYNKIWYFAAKYFPSLLTNCRPVKLTNFLEGARFKIIDKQIIFKILFPAK